MKFGVGVAAGLGAVLAAGAGVLVMRHGASPAEHLSQAAAAPARPAGHQVTLADHAAPGDHAAPADHAALADHAASGAHAAPHDQAAPSAARSSLAHTDHTARHGGLVFMDGDTHFEVVIDAAGGYAAYFSDHERGALPGSFVSEVRIAVTPPDRPGEVVVLEQDPTGSHWIGRGTPIDDPNTMVRISYAAGAGDYWIDVPAAGWGIGAH